MRILTAIAALAGITLIAGSNATTALGLGLIGLAGYLVVAGVTERLDLIEQGLRDLHHDAEAHRLASELARNGESLEVTDMGEASKGSV